MLLSLVVAKVTPGQLETLKLLVSLDLDAQLVIGHFVEAQLLQVLLWGPGQVTDAQFAFPGHLSMLLDIDVVSID